jgi:hypothetical protein
MKTLFHFAESQKNIDTVAKLGGALVAGFGVLLSIAILVSTHAR